MNNCQCFTYKKNNYIEENGIKEIFIRNEICKYSNSTIYYKSQFMSKISFLKYFLKYVFIYL